MIKHQYDSLKILLRRIDRLDTPQREISLGLQKVLTDPRSLLQSPSLREGHWLKEDSLIVLDALEAVTNGMENPRALEALESLTEDHPLYYWKQVIQALHRFYKKDHTEALSLLEGIPETHRLSRLKKILLPILKPGTSLQYTRREQAFLDHLVETSEEISHLLQQLEEGALSGFEDIFYDSFRLLIDQLYKDYPRQAGALALWALQTVQEEDLHCDDIFSYLQERFGKGEGCRLIALSLMEQDLEGALLFWIQGITHKLREGLSEALLDQGLLYLLEIYEALLGSEPPDEETQEHIRILLSLLVKELIQHNPQRWDRLNQTLQIEDTLRVLGETVQWSGKLPLFRQEENPQNHHTNEKPPVVGQLELF